MKNNKNLGTILFLILFATVSGTGALTIDTTLAGDGTPGPYLLGWFFVDSSSIRVSYADTARGNVPPFVYIESVNGILFSESIDSGVVLTLHYTTLFPGLKKTYSLYTRRYLDLNDTIRPVKRVDAGYASPFADDNMDISGFKSIGISLGSQGQMNMQQALEVRIFGKINENTELSANLSDQATSLQGDTREIGEIDRIYVALQNPRYNIVAGDIYVAMPPLGLIQGSKKIKGLSAAYTGKNLQVAAYGAISGGKYTVQSIKGRLGFQGPYYLTGSGEADIINPVAGTIKVVVNGRELKEGESSDYTVDYDIGAIRFMPTFPVDDNTIMQVTYEYKTFDYQRTFAGTDIGAITPDSSLSVRGAVWYETDNRDHPIDLVLDDVTINSLKESGDKTPLVPNGRRIHPNDVSTKDAIYRLYKIKKTDTTSTDSCYVYAPYNSATPLDNKDFYQVWFSPVAAGRGDYIQFSDTTDSAIITSIDPALLALLRQTLNKTDPRGPAYYYIGSGRGDYTAKSPAAAPRRNTKGEIAIQYNPRSWLSVSTDVAGEQEDKNLFSEIDDKDNDAAAAQSALFLGRNTLDRQCAWLGAKHSFASRLFSREIINPYERSMIWNREYGSTLGSEMNIWQVSSGATLVPGLSANLSYGQYISNKTLLTQSITYGAALVSGKHVTLGYSGRTIDHRDSSDIDRLTRDTTRARFDYTLVGVGLLADDEWLRQNAGENKGKIGSGIDFIFKPLSLTESVYYGQERKGGSSIFLPLQKSSRDTGSVFLWKQEISLSPTSAWKISGSSSFHQQKKISATGAENRLSVLLISASNDIASVKTGFSTHQDFRLSSEKASAYVQIPIYMGPGRGTHKYDSTLHEYVVDRLGDYIIAEREVFNNAGNENIRKSTFQGTWFFRPQTKKVTGILSDMSLNGSFTVDEHVRLDSALVAKNSFPGTTWIPGYSSLAGKNADLITFADLFYRQDADWRPSFIRNLHANIFVKPFLKKVRAYDETGVESGASCDKRWEKWYVKGEGRVHAVNRQDIWSVYRLSLKDRFLGSEQRYYMTQSFSLFTIENIGAASRDTVSGPYFRVQPGMTLRLPGKGWAELSYTYSYVNIPGRIEYPMAQGFNSGNSHVIDLIVDINAGDHFTVSGSYRGDFNDRMNEKWLHVVSMEVKAFL